MCECVSECESDLTQLVTATAVRPCARQLEVLIDLAQSTPVRFRHGDIYRILGVGVCARDHLRPSALQ